MIWLTPASKAVAHTWQTGVLVLTLHHCHSVRQPLACLGFTESGCTCGLLALHLTTQVNPGMQMDRTRSVQLPVSRWDHSLCQHWIPHLGPIVGQVEHTWDCDTNMIKGFAAGPHVHEHTCVTLLYAPAALGLFLIQQKLTATWHIRDSLWVKR